MNSAEPAVGKLGNTKPVSKEVKRYIFTLNNYSDEEMNKIIKTAESSSINYIIGKEVGEQGTPHLQGYINMPVKKSWSAVCKLFNNSRIHFEPCKGSEKANIVYCSKEHKWTSNFYIAEEELDIINELREWQSELNVILQQKAHERHIYWIYDYQGNSGKSSFCKYLCHKYKAVYTDNCKKGDIVNIVYNTPNLGSKSIILIDIPRSGGNRVCYQAIEQIKNGMVFNSKFETGMKLFNRPHIMIFSNAKPDIEELSSDKWKIAQIIENKLNWG